MGGTHSTETPLMDEPTPDDTAEAAVDTPDDTAEIPETPEDDRELTDEYEASDVGDPVTDGDPSFSFLVIWLTISMLCLLLCAQ